MNNEDVKGQIQKILDRVPSSILVDVLDYLKERQVRTVYPIPAPAEEKESCPVADEAPAPEKSRPAGTRRVVYPNAAEWNDITDIFH
ncbi:hypothetical protein [Larkinella soli]|uniref:hypothetical protein n=1 Tax=Larkinella soli TaxID=1770527 RepID=UPI000FFBB44F|nr:hypothetical protein [Larkinella soli]